jgi:putative endonuclease
MMSDQTRKDIGKLGEDIACQFLVRKGYKILSRNYRKPWGEIDVIAEKANSIRFVEVKAVSRESKYHEPEELVDERKLKKLARTAALYMETTKDQREYQIDVVGVILNKDKRIARCRLIEQAL